MWNKQGIYFWSPEVQCPSKLTIERCEKGWGPTASNKFIFILLYPFFWVWQMNKCTSTTFKNDCSVTLALKAFQIALFSTFLILNRHMILLNTRIQPGPRLLFSVLFENYAGTWIYFNCKQMKNLSSRSIYVVKVNVKYHYLCWFDAERRLFMNKILDWCTGWEALVFEIARTTAGLFEVIEHS
jgi:hypothetical protein